MFNGKLDLISLDSYGKEITLYPNPSLKEKCNEIKLPPNSTVKSIIGSMFDIMKRSGGLGLAAPQIGLNDRYFVCNVTGQEKDNKVFINPVVVDMVGLQKGVEGCLSLPGVTVECCRAKRIVVKAFDIEGEEFQEECSGLMARVICHEVDHINGILIGSRMTDIEKMTNKRALEGLKAHFRKEQEKEESIV